MIFPMAWWNRTGAGDVLLAVSAQMRPDAPIGKDKTMDQKTPKPDLLSRRRVLGRLGLAAGAAYLAPAMAGLNAARASGGGSAPSGGGSAPSRGRTRSRSRSRGSDASAPSRASGASGASRPRLRTGNAAQMPDWARRLMFGG